LDAAGKNTATGAVEVIEAKSSATARLRACLQIARDQAKSAPCAIVGIWPWWWEPLEAEEAIRQKAALYDELRRAFGERVKVVPE
jgi:hypothetical protein